MTYQPPVMTTAQMLADAQYKLHLLQTGRLSVEVEVEGRKVRYTRTDLDTLRGYVAQLEKQASGGRSRHGAIGFVF